MQPEILRQRPLSKSRLRLKFEGTRSQDSGTTCRQTSCVFKPLFKRTFSALIAYSSVFIPLLVYTCHYCCFSPTFILFFCLYKALSILFLEISVWMILLLSLFLLIFHSYWLFMVQCFCSYCVVCYRDSFPSFVIHSHWNYYSDGWKILLLELQCTCSHSVIPLSYLW